MSVNSNPYRSNVLTNVVCALVLLFSGRGVKAGTYSGGKGEPNDPYRIATAEDLNDIDNHPNDLNKHFIMVNDINLADYSGTSFNIIGEYDWKWKKAFKGVFDGNDRTISNFTYESTGVDNIGIFGYVRDASAEIKNVYLADPNVQGGMGNYVGTLVGRVDYGTIRACHVTGGKVSGNNYVGGLAGRNMYDTTIDCSAECDVAGHDYVGGLIGGRAWLVYNCYSMGSVSGNYQVGGLIGQGGSVYNSYASGNVTGNTKVGGLAGVAACYYSYASGNVSGITDVGGLLGAGSNYIYVISSFWDVETSGQPDSGGGLGKTTSEMQTGGTFIGWGCDSVWTIDEGNDYPRLSWENKPGALISEPAHWTGTGTEEDPYLIYTAEQLNTIGQLICSWDKHFTLMVDIDLGLLNGEEFNVIGTLPVLKFDGVFDGNGHTITSVQITSYDNSMYHGFFGYVGSAGQVKGLGLDALDVNAAGMYTGGLAGWNDGLIYNCWTRGLVQSGSPEFGGLVGRNLGSLEDCHSHGIVRATEDYANFTGGLVGQNGWTGTIYNCYSTCDVVTNYEYVGGLVGASGGPISGCYSTGNITCTSSYGTGLVGGLVGQNRSLISESFSTSNVSAEYEVGGLVGTNYNGTIVDSYSCGSITGYESVGGLVGLNWNSIEACYSSATVTGDVNIGCLVGVEDQVYASYWRSFWDAELQPDVNGIGNGSDPNVIGLPTAEMQDANTYMDAGWDFNTPIWKFCSLPDYPKLAWEACPGPVEPLEMLVELGEMVSELGLGEGTDNSLLAKVEAAVGVLEDDNEKNDGAAVNILGAFINAASAQSGKKIPEAQADALIAEAVAIIEALESE